MEKDIKREALRQYFKYFKIWFIIAGILAVITIGAAVVHALTPKPVRGNSQEPTERVYDYADMLTEEEEQSLREYIAECEEKIQADIVIVTISESVEYDLQDPDLPEAFHAKEVGSLRIRRYHDGSRHPTSPYRFQHLRCLWFLCKSLPQTFNRATEETRIHDICGLQ